MERLTEEQIQEINSNPEYDSEQGIYTTPFGLEKIQGKVIYQRVHTGGVRGGGYWEGAECVRYTESDYREPWKVLDEVLKIICPNISYLQYREIETLTQESSHEDYHDYYGNYGEYDIYYISLETLYEYLKI